MILMILLFLPFWVLIWYFLIGGAVISDRTDKYKRRLDALHGERSMAVLARDWKRAQQIAAEIDKTMEEWSDERRKSLFS